MAFVMSALMFSFSACAGFSKTAHSVIDQAGLVIADASNAISVAEAILPLLHLSEADATKVQSDIAKARTELSAAALAETAATELTDEQLDASLADFRQTWALIQEGLKPTVSKPSMAREVVVTLPVPLAVRRVSK